MSFVGCGLGIVLKALKDKFGKNIHDVCLQAQPYYEGFEERLADGLDIVEPSSQEEKLQKAPNTRAVEAGSINVTTLTIQKTT